jgi:putative ABC transport system permease protein
VLGASVFSLTVDLLKEFAKPVLLAAVIATPLTWWAMNKWLENFAYRINISWWVFLLTTFIVLSLAMLTMSIQSIKAALSNPVKNLRTE